MAQGIAPCGVLDSSAAAQLGVAYIHHHSDDQKQKYLGKHGDKPQVYPCRTFTQDGAKSCCFRSLIGSAVCMLERLRQVDVLHRATDVQQRLGGPQCLAFLSAYAYNAWPLLLDLTDGEVYHFIVIRDGELTYWDNSTPQQAYY